MTPPLFDQAAEMPLQDVIDRAIGAAVNATRKQAANLAAVAVRTAAPILREADDARAKASSGDWGNHTHFGASRVGDEVVKLVLVDEEEGRSISFRLTPGAAQRLGVLLISAGQPSALPATVTSETDRKEG